MLPCDAILIHTEGVAVTDSQMIRFSVFARDGRGGSATGIGSRAESGCLETAHLDGGLLRTLTPKGELPTGVNGALALGPGTYATRGGAVEVRRDGALLWARPAPVTLGSWVQPAFAARPLSIHPLDLDGAHLPQAANVGGVPVLLVPVERDALARATFAQRRMEELVLRQRFDITVPFALTRSTSSPIVVARFFAEPLGISEDPASGIAGAALAAWLTESRYLGAARDALVESGEALGSPSRMRLRFGPDGIEVGGEVGGPR